MSIYYDYIKIPQIETESEDEIVQGLGGTSGGGGASGFWGSEYDPVTIDTSKFPILGAEAETLLETYVSDAEEWFTICLENLELGIQQFENGDPITVPEPDQPPELNISIGIDWGAIVDVVLWIAKVVFKLLLWYFYNWFLEKIRNLKAGRPAEDSEGIIQALKDLTLVDAIVDFGGFKVHTVGKAIEK